MKKMTYGQSGVDLARYGKLLKNIKGNLKKHSELSGSGTFAGLLQERSSVVAQQGVEGVRRMENGGWRMENGGWRLD